WPFLSLSPPAIVSCHRLYFLATSFKVCVQGYLQVRACEHQRHRYSWI
ncbi:unnamed protein product, partial [Brassica oleracea]